MGELLKCPSCGGANQLPEGKNSMFCAFCGNVIEKVLKENNPSKEFPKIITLGKREKKIEDSWKYQALIEGFKLTSSTSIESIEHFRTNDGYNVRIKYNASIGSFSDDQIKTEFIPFEYDLSKYKSKLDLTSKSLASFEEILEHYDIREIENLTDLILDNNKIKDWSGIENVNFKYLNRLSIKNNSITSLPSSFTHERNGSEYDLKTLDLTNNNVDNITEINNDLLSCKIILRGNPIDINSFPQLIKTTRNNLKFKLSNIKSPLERNNKKHHYLEFIWDDTQKLYFEYQEHVPLPRGTSKKNDLKTKVPGLDKKLSENEKKLLGIKDNSSNNLKETDNNFLNNYSEIQIVLAIAHFISPLILALLIGDSLDEPNKSLSFISKIAVASFGMFCLFGIFVAGSTRKVKTGRSFKTKSGLSLDEYKDEHRKGMSISSIHAGIVLIHLAFSILVLIYNFIQFMK